MGSSSQYARHTAIILHMVAYLFEDTKEMPQSLHNPSEVPKEGEMTNKSRVERKTMVTQTYF